MPITTPPAPDANSYATVTDLEIYSSARGIALKGDAEHLLIRSMDYAQSLSFPGWKTDPAQPLAWPRTGAHIGPDRRRVASDEMPPEVVNAVLITALSIDAGRDPLAPIERAVKQEVVGPLSVTYADNASSRALDMRLQAAWRHIATGGAGGGNQFDVVRV